MSSQGLKSVFPMEDIAVMGLLELLPHLNKLRVSVIGLLSKSIIFVSFNRIYCWIGASWHLFWPRVIIL